MSKWNNIPYEILELVVKHVGDEQPPTTKWMFVNKQLYHLYLSKIYKNITIRLDSSDDNTLNNIFHSTVQPGRWVKSITFSKLAAPSNLDSLSLGVDPLCMLMSRCPLVEKVKFLSGSKMGAKRWSYFTAALATTNNWKLHYLKARQSNIYDNSQMYHNCTYHSRSSLEELILTKEIISRGYRCLEDFTNLTTLKIGENILIKGVNDCCQLLKYLSHLTDLTVDFSEVDEDDDHMEIPLGDEEEESLESTYPNLKRIQFLDYAPSSAEGRDILLIEKFTGLDYLFISWDGIDYNIYAKDFFKSIHLNIPKYCIKCDVDDADQFIKQYCDNMKDVKEADHVFHLSISVSYDRGESFMVEITRENSSLTIIHYKIDMSGITDDEELLDTTRNVLGIKHSIIDKVEKKDNVDNAIGELEGI